MGKLEAPITATPPAPRIGNKKQKQRTRAAKPEKPTEAARLERRAMAFAAQIVSMIARLEATGDTIAKSAASELDVARDACESAAATLGTLPKDFTLKRNRVPKTLAAGAVVQFRDRYVKQYVGVLPNPGAARFTVIKIVGKIAVCKIEEGMEWPLPIGQLKPADTSGK
jgi:hypothetical protein